jgi:hypothetical protein
MPLPESLERYLNDGNSEYLSELGQDFSKRGGLLGGYALCSTSQEPAERLKNLIVDIDGGKSCTDSDLALMTRSVPK